MTIYAYILFAKLHRGRDNPIQYSCLVNPMDRGAWRLQSIGSHRVRPDWSDFSCMHVVVTQRYLSSGLLQKQFAEPLTRVKLYLRWETEGSPSDYCPQNVWFKLSLEGWISSSSWGGKGILSNVKSMSECVSGVEIQDTIGVWGGLRVKTLRHQDRSLDPSQTALEHLGRFWPRCWRATSTPCERPGLKCTDELDPVPAIKLRL